MPRHGGNEEGTLNSRFAGRSLEEERRSEWWHCTVAAALGLVACSRFPLATLPLTADNQIYYYIAERVASGVPPHASEFDVKNALSTMLAGSVIYLGRQVGVDDIVAVRSLGALTVVGTFSLAWIVTYRLTRSRLAAYAVMLLIIQFRIFLLLTLMGARPKALLIPLGLLSILGVATARPRLFAAGSIASFLTWQPSGLCMVAGIAAFSVLPDRKTSCRQILVTYVLVLLAYESYFIWHGILQDQLYQSMAAQWRRCDPRDSWIAPRLPWRTRPLPVWHCSGS